MGSAASARGRSRRACGRDCRCVQLGGLQEQGGTEEGSRHLSPPSKLFQYCHAIHVSTCPPHLPSFMPRLPLVSAPSLKKLVASLPLPCPPLSPARSTLKMTDDVLCVRVSPNGKLLAASLLDSTVRVFFLDSLKFFLSLYGHKLPVLSMDISSGRCSGGGVGPEGQAVGIVAVGVLGGKGGGPQGGSTGGKRKRQREASQARTWDRVRTHQTALARLSACRATPATHRCPALPASHTCVPPHLPASLPPSSQPCLFAALPSDSTLLVTGSADKNIKAWGLDFGDCHRSLFAHGDSVMAVAFVPNTHYLFTAGARGRRLAGTGLRQRGADWHQSGRCHTLPLPCDSHCLRPQPSNNRCLRLSSPRAASLK